MKIDFCSWPWDVWTSDKIYGPTWTCTGNSYSLVPDKDGKTSLVLAGIDKLEVRVEVGKLFISGEYEGTEVKYQCNIPTDTDLDRVECSYKNGVLKFILPKKNTGGKKIKVVF